MFRFAPWKSRKLAGICRIRRARANRERLQTALCNTSGEPAGARAVVHARTTCKTAPTWRTSVPSVLRSATATTVNHIMSCISSVKESPRPRISDRGPHSRHGAECSHGRCQRSRTRSQASFRADHELSALLHAPASSSSCCSNKGPGACKALGSL